MCGVCVCECGFFTRRGVEGLMGGVIWPCALRVLFFMSACALRPPPPLRQDDGGARMHHTLDTAMTHAVRT